MAEESVSAPVPNRFDRMEVPGAFGDLGTLVPSVVAYIASSRWTRSACCSPLLFLTGAQLALGACDISKDKGERFVMRVTGALAVWNVGLASSSA